ncbi:MAG: helix-turn-helix transcriptional regulator [Rickettsiales bacterium]|nr:helix-turn-helix transcriptional regulator [Rickettsiales bacterium]
MMKPNDNERAYQYNKAINYKLRHICQPFLNASKASVIAYHKVYYEGSAVSVATNYKVLKEYYLYVQRKGLFFLAHLHNIPTNKLFYFLWPETVENELHDLMIHLGIWNGFNIYIKHKDCIENFVFTGDLDNKIMQNYCINNLELVDSFIGYFIEKAHEFIYNIDKRNMAFFNYSNTIKTSPSTTPKISSIFDIKKIPLYINNNKIYLTKRQALCISFIADGHSVKNASSILNISYRTIEKHIDNIRSKADNMYRDKLIDLVNLPENTIIKNLKSVLKNEYKT